MATHHGKLGTVKIGSNAIAELRNWNVREQAETAEDTAMGDTWKTHITGQTINSWTASITAWWDETDTNGQEAMTVGASVTVNLYPEGSGAAAVYYTGTATIVDRGVEVPMGSTVERSFQLQGNGALTQSTVGA